ncbi:amino acid adenylation domain-containing protein [Rhodococcus spelaei]|uniref:Amino acid adenylation domain-containing protein n=1 Tax=Rhodococcus spelaei TaxID=2546320 RepID=A0A541B819_9NOCA|nr:Pls/PosA family non-ribosomal peptide synthetase [Rhodococcus spelaei]TQF68440.1 amino acid adenylation domain-containing protein [Rhodococcus spelaei]
MSTAAHHTSTVRVASRRAQTRRLEHVFEATVARTPHATALECDGHTLTYADLEQRANQLAHYLIELRAGVGARVAILLERSPETYIALLAVLKAGAAFVPIDPASPADRIDYITTDADVDLVLTSTHFSPTLATLEVPWMEVDADAMLIAQQPTTRPGFTLFHRDPAAYIIYTSGSTGRPKGVEVAQSSICNFLDIVPTVYDVQPTDRVYQGMTISFDFSIEEIWPTWAVGATLVAGPTGAGRLGGDLADFLETRAITVLYCVPTLLATIPRDLPLLRNILVGGEACPRELVDRWGRPGRRILNTYGPTEATVTATWCELLPGRPVTIGVPLPTYSVVIIDEQRTPLADGEVGEICIGGPGVARGYVGRPDLTADRFFTVTFTGAPQRIYRTGDLGRITPDGEIEYLGRADSEVKIRGHRVDLGEIESVLLVDEDVASAVVSLVTVAGVEQLASWAVLMPGSTIGVDTLVARLHDEAHRRLPDYMVPTFFDIVPELPMMPSGKVDRPKLPAPTGRRLAITTGPVVAAGTDLEHALRELFSGLLGLPAAEVSVEADFFTDLGGHSLAAAQLVTRLRESGIAPGAGIRDVYASPTVRSLAARLGDVAAPTGPADPTGPTGPAPDLVPPIGNRSVRRAGLVQGIFILAVLLVVTAPVSIVYSNHHGQPSFEALVDLLVATVPTYLLVRWVLPVLAIRPLSAGIAPGRYRLWGATYLRLWMVEHLMMLAPMPVLSGSPLMARFLRALGADVGRDTHIGTSIVSFPALVRIGDGASIGNNTDIRSWRVVGREVVVAPVVVGARAFVAANCVLEPGTTIGDDAMLGDQSVLSEGASIPPGHRWTGSPPVRVDALAPRVEAMAAAGPSAGWTPKLLALNAFGIVTLEALAIATIVPSLVLVWAVLLEYGMIASLLATLASGFVYVVSVCFVVAVGKKLILPALPEGTFDEASALGVRKWATDKLFEMSLLYTNTLYATLYTAPWLRLLGAKVGSGAEVSTVSHIDPDLLTINDESFVADMASLGGSSFCNGRMSFARTEIGARAFIGNAAVLPSGMSTGEGSLVGVLTVPPATGVPADSSWLGNPAIFLPVRQDSGDFDENLTFSPDQAVLAHRWWIEFFRIVLPPTAIGVSLYFYLLGLSQIARTTSLAWTIVTAPLLALVTAIGVVLFAAAVKRNLVGRYRPRVEPLWAKFVRRSEFATGMYESAAVPVLLNQLTGTPYLPMMLRWFGAEMGSRVWIGTTYLTEFDLVRIGDDAVVGPGVSLQTHLFEDRVMKMSTVTVEAGATVGTRAVVLYDAVVSEHAELEALSLLMKGEQLPARTRWQGIPAQAVRS